MLNPAFHPNCGPIGKSLRLPIDACAASAPHQELLYKEISHAVR